MTRKWYALFGIVHHRHLLLSFKRSQADLK